MIRNRRYQSILCRVLLISFLSLQLQIAGAGMLSTHDLLIESNSVIQTQAQLFEQKKRQQQKVTQALTELGINKDIATQRVAALSDTELHSLSTQLDELPAGGDILGTAVFVFLVLLVTDILGFTDIFPFVKKTVHGRK